MHIGVTLRDEHGGILQTLDDPDGVLSALLRRFRSDLAGSACLRFIDPTVDTTLNRLQAAALLGDLAGLRPRLDDRSRALVDRLIELAEAVEKGSHLYLHFQGD